MPYRRRMSDWKKDRAKEMREQPTRTEDRLWQHLRCKRLGFKVRRQAPMLGFIVDFYAPQKKLVIEVDGSSHVGKEKSDSKRDAIMKKCGLKVLRVTNDEVFDDLQGTLEKIMEAA